MTILLDDDILAVWFLQICETSNWIAGLSKHPQGFLFTSRMRYYAPGSPTDSNNPTECFEKVTQESEDAAIEQARDL